MNWGKLLNQRLFWAHHFTNIMGFDLQSGEVDEKRESELWKLAFQEPSYTPLSEIDSGPFNEQKLEIEIDDYTWTLEFFFEEESATGHRLYHGSWEKPVLLGFNDPHFHLPFIRWSELTKILGRRLQSAVSSHYVPLLLLQGIGLDNSDDLNGVRQTLQTWLSALKIFSEEGVAIFADALLQKGYNWVNDDDFGWIQESPNSHRNPDEKHWKQQDFDYWQQFYSDVLLEQVD